MQQNQFYPWSQVNEMPKMVIYIENVYHTRNPQILFRSIALKRSCIHLLSRHFNINDKFAKHTGRKTIAVHCITSNRRNNQNEPTIKEHRRQTCSISASETAGERQYFIVFIHVCTLYRRCLLVVRTTVCVIFGKYLSYTTEPKERKTHCSAKYHSQSAPKYEALKRKQMRKYSPFSDNI